MVRQRFRTGFSRSIESRWAFAIRLAIAVAALHPVIVGRGQPRLFLLLALVLPGALFLMDAPFRRRQLGTARGLWAGLRADVPEWRRWWAGFVFVGAPVGLIYLLHPYGHIDSGDTWAVVPTAASVVREGNAEIREFVPLAPREYSSTDKELPYGAIEMPHGVYSRYPAGMTLYAVPFVGIAYLAGADLDDPKTIDALDRSAAAGVAVLLGLLFFRTALHLTDPPAALAATWLLAVGSGVYSTISQTLWQHGGVMIGFLLLLNGEYDPRLRQSRWGLALQGFAVGTMFACRLSSGVLVAAFGLWLLGRDPRRALKFGLAAAVGLLPWILFYQFDYGTPLGPAQSQMAAGGWRTDLLEPLAGVLFSPGRGLFVYQSWVALALWGLWLGRRSDRTWMLAASAVLHILLISGWTCWWGGSAWGSRLLCETLPLFALLCLQPIKAILKWKWGRAIAVVGIALAAVPHTAGIWCFGLSANWKLEEEPTMWSPPAWEALL